MKKFFKNPEMVKSKGHKVLIKALKTVLEKMGNNAYKFFYKADFDYGEEGSMPFMYIGSTSGTWKEYYKNSKKDPDFAAGICQVKTAENGEQTLLLCVEKGKGGKAIFLKSLNKEILKRVGVWAEFVDVIEAPLVDDSEEEEESIGNSNENTKNENNSDDNQSVNPKEHLEEIKKIVSDFKVLQGEFDEEKLDAIIEAIDDWHDNHEVLDDAIKEKLGKVGEQAVQIREYLKKVAAVDEKLEDLLEDAAGYIEEWHDTEDEINAKILEKLVLKKIEQVEKMAMIIKDKKIIGYCSKLKEAFA